MEPPESRITRHGHRDRSGDSPKGRRPVRLRGIYLRPSNSQSQRHANATTKGTRRSHPQRHMPVDRANCESRQCNSDDVPLCTKDKDGKGSKGILPQIERYFRARRTPHQSRSEPTEAASTGSKWLSCVGKKQRHTPQNKTALQNRQTG